LSGIAEGHCCRRLLARDTPDLFRLRGPHINFLWQGVAGSPETLACNGVQGPTATLAFSAILALWIL
jgi:hypothetical protein